MAAAGAAGAAAPAAPPGVNNPPSSQREWFNMDVAQFYEQCVVAYNQGNYNWVKQALQANHNGFTSFIRDRTGTGTMTLEETYIVTQMTAKCNAALLSIINRSEVHEHQTNLLRR